MWMNRLRHKVSPIHTECDQRKWFSWNNADVVMERYAPDVALRLFAAQGACASGTGGSVAALPSTGIDRECRASLEKLCEGIEPGSGRLRKCYDENQGKLTPSCRQQVEEHKSEAAAILLMTPTAAHRAASRSLNANVCARAKPTSQGSVGIRSAGSSMMWKALDSCPGQSR